MSIHWSTLEDTSRARICDPCHGDCEDCAKATQMSARSKSWLLVALSLAGWVVLALAVGLVAWLVQDAARWS